MQIVASPETLQKLCLGWKRSGLTIVLVPTMGYFHAGHEALMRRARELGDKVVVSLFVNPTQFGPGEDLSTYPRDGERDAATAARLGADVLFTPEAGAMYPEGHATWVDVPSLGSALCGKTRPTHFRGVCTVVNKLFMQTGADTAVFGEKDWQQLAILRRMVRDLNIPIELVGVSIVREADGLAMSSRNAYLTSEERAQAPHLQKGLALARQLSDRGVTDTALLARAVREYWQQHFSLGREDYLSFAHPQTLQPVDRVEGATLVAAAVYLGKARLIDNVLIGCSGG